MTETASVVIIGGGIVGHALAWNLAKRGCSDVIILEKEKRIGSGSTAYSAGGVREQFTSEVNIRMSRSSKGERRRSARDMRSRWRRCGKEWCPSWESVRWRRSVARCS